MAKTKKTKTYLVRIWAAVLQTYEIEATTVAEARIKVEMDFGGQLVDSRNEGWMVGDPVDEVVLVS